MSIPRAIQGMANANAVMYGAAASHLVPYTSCNTADDSTATSMNDGSVRNATAVSARPNLSRR